MQTFLPFPDFRCSAQCLDMRRLGKQRVEALQILMVLRGQMSGWARHPAVRMWDGHVSSLTSYMKAMIDEWTSRGYRDTIWANYGPGLLAGDVDRVDPPWLGSEGFHASHRSRLLSKDYSYYSRFGWSEEPGLELVWPVR